MMNIGAKNIIAEQVVGSYLKEGIHKVMLESVEVNEKTLDLTFSNSEGKHIRKIFEPKSDVRTKTIYGETASMWEHTTDFTLQLLESINPTIYKDIVDGKMSIDIPSWEVYLNKMKTYFSAGIGKEVQIKLIPNKNLEGKIFNNMPTFTTSVTKAGTLVRSNRIVSPITMDLSFLPKELIEIEKYKNLKPTDMRTEESGNKLDAVRADIDDDLPF